MSWDETIDNNGGGSSLFVKLKDGDAVEGVFLGDPVTHYVLWENGKTKPSKKGEKGASFRFKTNFVVKHGDKWVPMILEQGVTVYRAVQQLRNTGYSLADTIVRLSRTGTGTDTEYSLLPSPKKLSQNDIEDLSSVRLNDLTK